MRGQFMIKQLGGVFEQDVKVTTFEEKDVPIEVGDTVIVQVRAMVKAVIPASGGSEIELIDVQPHKVVQVLRKKKS